MTNYEKIKSMSIEELAVFIANEIPHGDCYGCRLCHIGNSCEDGWLKWLQGSESAYEQEDE